MSALPNNIVPFELPKKPRVIERQPEPDQRKLAILPIRAGADRRLHGGTLRCLIVLCSYCNRAGLTWVSQARLGQDLGISRQAVQKQIALLIQTGYVELVRKGFRAEFSNTLRVIFDPSISAEDAIAMTSNKEDSRPPAMRLEQQKALEADPEGQRRIAQLISKALKQPAKPRSYSMPTSGETRTVREMKEAIKKGQSKRTKAVDKSSHKQPPEVAHEEGLHTQPGCQPPEVAPTGENIGIDKVKDRDKALVKDKAVLRNLSAEQRAEVAAAGVTDAEAADALEHLLAAYQAEGLAPPAGRLAFEVISIAAVGRGIA